MRLRREYGTDTMQMPGVHAFAERGPCDRAAVTFVPRGLVGPLADPDLAYLNVVSTKRSGHHAFVGWLENGLGRPTVFANNIVIGRPLASEIARRGTSEPRFAQPLADGRAPLAICNFEGVTRQGLAATRRQQQDAATGKVVDLLFLRDPLNTVASLLHRKGWPRLHLVMVLRQVFALQQWLDVVHAGGHEAPALVLYNRWLASASYRKRVEAVLGLLPSVPLALPAQSGSASSFGDIVAIGDSAKQRLLTRWYRYRHDEVFAAIVTHPVFAPSFLRYAEGDVTDIVGDGDAPLERAAFLRQAMASRRGDWLVDRMIDGLARHPGVFADIERSRALAKKGHILEAHLRSLLG